jgi:hypothetical protein
MDVARSTVEFWAGEGSACDGDRDTAASRAGANCYGVCEGTIEGVEVCEGWWIWRRGILRKSGECAEG